MFWDWFVRMFCSERQEEDTVYSILREARRKSREIERLADHAKQMVDEMLEIENRRKQ